MLFWYSVGYTPSRISFHSMVLKTRKYHQTSFLESSWICSKLVEAVHEKSQLIWSKFLWGPSLLVILKTWIATSYKFHGFMNPVKLAHLSNPTKTQQETKPFEGPFQSFRLSNPPVLMMFKWFLWLQNRGTCSFILLPDVYIVYGSLEWFYWNIPLPWGMLAPHPSQKESRLTNVTTRASILRGGEHLKHSLIFFSLWMIESECSKRCLLVLYRGWNTNQLYGNYTVGIPVNQLL